jgi:hypothetical protein
MGLNAHRLNTKNKNQLHILTTHLSTFQKGVTQELGYLIDCPVIFNISGMKGCVLRINFENILLLICFIQLLNF